MSNGVISLGVMGMKRIQDCLRRFWRDEIGISSVEYALLVAFIAGGIVVAAGELSDAIKGIN